MTPREALAALFDVALISESDRARLLAAIPSMTDDEVQRLGEVFADEEIAVQERLSTALKELNAFLTTQIPGASAE